MKLLLIILVFVGFAAADTSKWLEFRVKYSNSAAGAGVNSFWLIPKTLTDALLDGWNPVTTTNSLGATTLCYMTDHRVCPLYDKKGTIAGLLLAIPPSDVEGHGIPYDFKNFPVYEKKMINNVDYWTSTYYLVDPAVVEGDGRPNNIQKIGEGIWLKSGNSFTKVPTDLPTIQSSTPYTWQNCIPNMGIHYYYNMTTAMRCEDAQPYFLLIKEGNMIGLGWQFNGRTKPVLRNYYDAINKQAVMATVPLAPPCLSDGADEYGVISIHTYFVEKPWTIPCDQSTESVVPLPIP